MSFSKIKPLLNRINTEFKKILIKETQLIIDLIYIIICYNGNDPFDTFEGKFIRTIDYCCRKLSHPYCIIEHNKQIYVGDVLNKRILVLDKNGKYLSKIKMNSQPMGIETYESKLFVANTNTNIPNIEIFDLPSGKPNNFINCYWPSFCIFIFKSHIYTSYQGKNIINVFTLNGERVRQYTLIEKKEYFGYSFCIENDEIYSVSSRGLFQRTSLSSGKCIFNKFLEVDNPHIYSLKVFDYFIYIGVENEIQKYDFNGQLIKKWSLEKNDNIFFGKIGSFIFLDNKCYVASWSENHISIYE